ncbi:MAG: hypothetical protein HYV67_01010 [Candidatus Taylorbacteria bacterium]|nr:hypothetical protein [Candidatus Taylorbacteria bacterium]
MTCQKLISKNLLSNSCELDNRLNILGTGLGLYVAKEMIKAHGGRVWVESFGEGKGSTFFVELALV